MQLASPGAYNLLVLRGHVAVLFTVVQLHLVLDGLSVALILLVCAVMPSVILWCSRGLIIAPASPRHCALLLSVLLLVALTMCCAFLCGDLWSFFLAFEASLLPLCATVLG